MPERLIDANALYREIKTECNPYGKPTIGFDDGKKVLELIDAAPTIDAEPVRHGLWQWSKGYVGTMAECSVCGLSPMSFYSLPKNQIGRLPVYKYCPRCGARMDGGADNG